MAERAYNLPSANVHTLKFSNVHMVDIYSTLVLNVDSSKIQFLKPHGSDQIVEMPDATLLNGCIFWIENVDTSYNINVYNHGQITQLVQLKPSYRTALISDGVVWRASTSTPTGSATTKFETTIGPGAAWVLDNSGRPAGSNWYYHDINHNLNIQYLNVSCIDVSNNAMVIPAEIIFTDANNMRIWIGTDTIGLRVVLIG